MPKKVNTIKKSLGLFDYLSNLTHKKVSWDEYNESDIKNYNPYMINKWLSMNYDLIEFVNVFQKYTIGLLGKREHYKLYLGFLPKSKIFMKYIKSKKSNIYSEKLIEYLEKYFEISKQEIISYLDIYYSKNNGIEEIKDILKKYGLEEKKIEQLTKLKN